MTTSPSKSTGTAVVAFLPRAATIISHLGSVARCPFPQLQHLSGPCPQFFPFRPQSLQTWSLDKCAEAQNLHIGLVVHCLQWFHPSVKPSNSYTRTRLVVESSALL